jgi:hypothetical protein
MRRMRWPARCGDCSPCHIGPMLAATARARMTCIRSCNPATSALAVVMTMARGRVVASSGQRKPSHRPANAIGCPSGGRWRRAASRSRSPATHRRRPPARCSSEPSTPPGTGRTWRRSPPWRRSGGWPWRALWSRMGAIATSRGRGADPQSRDAGARPWPMGELGARLPMPMLLWIEARNVPGWWRSAWMMCGVHFPGLSGL